jgi:hypothetical protein
MDVVSYNSFRTNDDGEGFWGFQNGKDIKQDRSFFKLRYAPHTYWFLASHQRFKTSGDGLENIHPHETKDLIIEHNGVFYALGDKDKSDTKKFAEKLQEEYDVQGGDLIKAIGELMPKMNGSYSVLILDKNTKRVYYFKDRATSMYKVENDKYLIMSTDEDNASFGKWFFEIDTKVEEVKPYVIYNILNGFKSVGKFKDYVDSKTYCAGYNYYSWESGKSEVVAVKDEIIYSDCCEHERDKCITHFNPLTGLEKSKEKNKDSGDKPKGDAKEVTLGDVLD